jgi:hypothetical protein
MVGDIGKRTGTNDRVVQTIAIVCTTALSYYSATLFITIWLYINIIINESTVVQMNL